jgi:uncharacterized protein (TIGR00251 family)
MGRKPYRRTDEGIRLAVRLTPRGGRAGFDGVGRDADDTAFVRARVSAPPVDGRANRALVRLIARALDVPASRCEIVLGAKARQKTIGITGDPAALAKRLDRWLEEMS